MLDVHLVLGEVAKPAKVLDGEFGIAAFKKVARGLDEEELQDIQSVSAAHN